MCTWPSVHKCISASAASFILGLLQCTETCHAACKVNIKARSELSSLSWTGLKRGFSLFYSAGAGWMAALMCRVQTAGGNNAEGLRATTHGETCAYPQNSCKRGQSTAALTLQLKYWMWLHFSQSIRSFWGVIDKHKHRLSSSSLL